MKVRSEVLSEESAETLSNMGMVEMVGLASSLGGKYKEAEAMHRHMMARREKVLGRKHPNAWTSV